MADLMADVMAKATRLVFTGRLAFTACAVALIAAGGLLPAGCVTEQITSSDGRRAAKPRPAPVAPPETPVDRLALIVGSKPLDTTGNGYPDQIHATVVLFPRGHDSPVHQEGTFVFTLWEKGDHRDPGAEPLAVWRLQGEEVSRARSRAAYGPNYFFRLSLLEQGGDRLPLSYVDLHCEYQPAGEGGRIVQSDGMRSFQIGRRRSSG